MERRNSRQINVGGVLIGGNAPISVQSMCNTDTRDVSATVNQIAELQKAKLIKSDILGGFELQDAAIILVENQPAEKLKELLTLASQVLPPVVSKILEAYS